MPAIYMSADRQRAEKSVLLLEWVENKQELQRITAVAARLSESFSSVAEILKTDPARVDISGLDIEAVKQVGDAIQKLKHRQSELRPRMAAFHLPLD